MKRTVESQYCGTAAFSHIVAVQESYNEQTVWNSAVQVFDVRVNGTNLIDGSMTRITAQASLEGARRITTSVQKPHLRLYRDADADHYDPYFG